MFSLFLLILCVTNVCGEDTVKFAAVIFRHGDRTPVAPYPKDPWKNESLWPVKFGQLTNVGKRQHYAFGKWIRERYSHLVSRFFDPSEVYVRSTDVDRTLMSAQSNLAGLYPPTGEAVWNPELLWQPIPVHTVPESQDELLAMKKACPAYEKELSTYTQSVKFKAKLNLYKNMMDYLAAHSGAVIQTYDDVMDLYSTLYIETLYKFPLPKWTYMVYPGRMREPACYSFTVQTGTPFLARLKAGPILKHIHTHLMKAYKSKNGKHRKLHIYSGHDITIGNVLHALGLYDGVCPCYTAAIFIELIMDNSTSEHYVKISYRNSTDDVEPVVLDIPNCGTKCAVSRFTDIYENLLTVNWESECAKGIAVPLLIGLLLTFIGFTLLYILHKMHAAHVFQKQLCLAGNMAAHMFSGWRFYPLLRSSQSVLRIIMDYPFPKIRSNAAFASFLTTTITPLKLVED